jgi:glycosyltransferase involved in cell wall biosynthesis
MPAVSFVIPCYNGGATLPRTIASIQAQTFTDLEIIVVDDGSTDAQTTQYLDHLPTGIRLIRQKNSGLPAARNAGFRGSQGRYVVPLDCDDFVAPVFLERLLVALDLNKDAAFAFSHIQIFGERDGLLARSYNFFEQLFTNQLPYCLLLPKRIWEEVGGYDEKMRQGYEDWEFNIRLGKCGYFGVSVPEPLFHYSVSSAGMLKSTSARMHAQLWGYIQNKHPDLYTYAALFRQRQRWSRQPMAYPAYLYFMMYLFYQMTPVSLFNKAFNSLRMFSASERIA